MGTLFASLVASRNAFDWMLVKGKITNLKMLEVFPGTSFKFLSFRKPAFVFSAAMLIFIGGFFGVQGSKVLGVDFVGGDLLMLSYSQKFPGDEVRKIAGDSSVVQYQDSVTGGEAVLSVRSPFGQGEEVETKLREAFPEAMFKRVQLDKVEGTIGDEFKWNALVSIILGMIGIYIYVMVRFESAFAIGALVAVAHDVIIALGIFALLGREYSLTTVGAILTVAGYSINDTIIIFDRIREQMKLSTDNLETIIDEALNSTLSRTMITSGTTLMAILALYVFGGRVINDFALMLLVGIVIGTYSSLFVASPIVLMLKKKKR